MANSWIEAASIFGFSLTLACPEGYDPDPDILAAAREKAEKPITLLRDPVEAITDAERGQRRCLGLPWQEQEQEERIAIFQPYQLNSELLARPRTIRCPALPAGAPGRGDHRRGSGRTAVGRL